MGRLAWCELCSREWGLESGEGGGEGEVGSDSTSA